MHVMVLTEFPPHKAAEVAKTYIKREYPKTPTFVKQLYLVVNTAHNIKGYQLFKIEDAKIKEGLAYLNQVQAEFISIEGYKLRIEVVLTPEEALPLYGFKTT
ncbi:MAG: hypothetical protein ACFFCF_03265 [Promethearchaeota archaeon]